jgi:hypothetical protein
MKRTVWGVTIGLLAILPLGSVVYGQEQAGSKVQGEVVVPTERRVPPMRFAQTPLRAVLAQISKASGVWVIADSSVAGIPITMETRRGSLTEVLADLVKQLPPEARVRYVGVPAAENAPEGDAVSRYISAQDALQPTKGKGTTNTPTIASEIDVAGRTLAADQAAPLMMSLNLKPVYLVTNPSGDALIAKAARMQTEGLQLWMEMNPEQRSKMMENQLNSLLNMDPTARRSLFEQMSSQGMAMMQKIQSLPPEQRAQFFRDITGGKFDGTTPPPPNGPNLGGGSNGGGGR